MKEWVAFYLWMAFVFALTVAVGVAILLSVEPRLDWEWFA